MKPNKIFLGWTGFENVGQVIARRCDNTEHWYNEHSTN